MNTPEDQRLIGMEYHELLAEIKRLREGWQKDVNGVAASYEAALAELRELLRQIGEIDNTQIGLLGAAYAEAQRLARAGVSE